MYPFLLNFVTLCCVSANARSRASKSARNLVTIRSFFLVRPQRFFLLLERRILLLFLCQTISSPSSVASSGKIASTGRVRFSRTACASRCACCSPPRAEKPESQRPFFLHFVGLFCSIAESSDVLLLCRFHLLFKLREPLPSCGKRRLPGPRQS